MTQGPADRDTSKAPDAGPAHARRQRDDTDYAHRHFVNLVAAAFLTLLAVAMTWTFKSMDAQEELRRCVASGRKDCIEIQAPPRGMLQAVR